jgi:hypothetical protein
MATYIDAQMKGEPDNPTAPVLRMAIAVHNDAVLPIVMEKGTPAGGIDPARCLVLLPGTAFPDGMLTIEDSFDTIVERLRTA